MSALILLSPAGPSPDARACPVDEAGEAGAGSFAAGCLVRRGEKMLVVRHRFSGKLGIPAGYVEGGESVPCAAYRETREETGLEVRVRGLLRTFDDGFSLFHCSVPGTAETDAEMSVPASATAEITEVFWLNPNDLPRSHWRFPGQHAELLRLFNALDAD